MFNQTLKNQYINFFGNTISVKINLLHYLYDFLAKAFFLAKGKGRNLRRRDSNELYQNGMHKMDPFLSPEVIQKIKNKTNDCFSDNSKVITNLSDSGLIRLKNSLCEIPELEEYINDSHVSSFLKEYYRADYKLFSCDVYRTIPSSAKDKEDHFNSLLWHFDNCPENLIKVMIYINDVAIENGAISLVDKSKSIELRKKGYWNRWNSDKFLPEIERSKIYLEGQAGTVLFFSTHFCIHKATLPERGYRDVAVFLIQPSLKDNGNLDNEYRLKLSKNFGYCVNPFTNKALRVGDE